MLSYRKIASTVSFIVFVVCSCASPEDIAALEIIDPEIEDQGVQLSVPVDVEIHPEYTMPRDYNPHPQGGDCWGDYFFQFSNNNSIVRIHNLAEKKYIQELTLSIEDRGFVSNCHCNSVCFGSSYYYDGDEFPLLYVSTGYACDGYTGALVYRVMKENELFTLSLVQTLRFPELDVSWTEFVPAGDECYVCYGKSIYKMPLPSAHAGDVIIDCSKGPIEVFRIPSPPEIMKGCSNQGKMYHNGKLIFPSGMPPGQPSVLVFLDLKTRTYEYVFSLTDLGLLQEAESIFIWNGKLCVAFLDQVVSFEFSPDIL